MAKGSTKSLGGWEPKHCRLCGERVTVTGPRMVRYHFNDLTGETYSWHVECEKHLGWPDLGRTT